MNTDAQAASDEQDAVEAARIPLTRALEAMLFLADEPTSLVALATACGAPVAQVRDALAELQADYDGVDGICLLYTSDAADE